MFPQRLDSPLAYDIAKAMRDGFDRHYRLFRAESSRAKHRFETADWHGQQRAQRERIEFYDLRVNEAVARLEKEFKAGEQPMDVWHQIKLHFIGLLVDHHQPELAETFFNSVTTKILHRAYFQNDFIFVRPAISTEYIEPRGAPTYRAYYPAQETLADTVQCILDDYALQGSGYAAMRRDAERVAAAILGRFHQIKLRANFQVQVLSGLFYRNKGAYVVGKIINGFTELPFLPILTTARASSMSMQCSSAKKTCRCSSALRARISWSTWKCRRPTCSFCDRSCPGSRARKSTTRWGWPSSARRFSTATFSPT